MFKKFLNYILSKKSILLKIILLIVFFIPIVPIFVFGIIQFLLLLKTKKDFSSIDIEPNMSQTSQQHNTTNLNNIINEINNDIKQK